MKRYKETLENMDKEQLYAEQEIVHNLYRLNPLPYILQKIQALDVETKIRRGQGFSSLIQAVLDQRSVYR